MRPIKFRAWFNNMMWHVSSYSIGGLVQLMGDGTPRLNLPIMQFTGLKDRHGKEIYEYCEINNKYMVLYYYSEYVLTDISSGDIISFKKGDNYEITKDFISEYTEVSKNAKRGFDKHLSET